MSKLTIQDLAAKRDEARKHLNLREEGEYRAKIVVHMGTCGIAAGARDVMRVVLEQVEASDTTDVYVGTSGCAGLCSKEPMATVHILDESPVMYGELNAEKMTRIFKEHVMGGKPVEEYALGVGSEWRG